MGQLPTHPELLDWLAAEFRDGGQSLKQLHRLIVTQRDVPADVGRLTAAALGATDDELDADNVYLWRMNRRKLEAEAVRDAVLAVAGKLDRPMGGPSFQDFVIEQPGALAALRVPPARPGRPRVAPPLDLPLHRPLAAAAVHDRARLRRPVDAGRQAERDALAAAGAGPAQQRLDARRWPGTSPRGWRARRAGDLRYAAVARRAELHAPRPRRPTRADERGAAGRLTRKSTAWPTPAA